MKSRLQNICDGLYQNYFPWAGIFAVFLLPLKLTAAYILFFPALLIWLAANAGGLQAAVMAAPQGGRLLLFYATAFLGAVFGINPERSLLKLPMAALYALSIFMFKDLVLRAGSVRVLTALILGQSVSSFYSLVESASQGRAPQLFIGTVSESGQLAMTLIVALGLIIETASAPARSARRNGWMLKSTAALCLPLFALPAFSYYFRFNHSLQLVLFAAAGLAALIGWLWMLSGILDKTVNLFRIRAALIACLAPLMSVALLANLKRGPWLGTCTGALLLLVLCRKKYTIVFVLAAAAALFLLQPVRTRLADSYRDYTIRGGRNAIWSVGAELLTAYPLGIGYKNSGFLREFAPEVPPELRHFHNTGLNVLIETGWIGLFAFVWWIWGLLQSAFRSFRDPPLKILPVSIGCAVVSWIMAGSVEYNFGDSEVVLVLYLLAGILALGNSRAANGASSCGQ